MAESDLETAETAETAKTAETVELPEAWEIVGAAAWAVRETARFNMIVEAGEAWTAAMCIVAIWGRADIVDWMNALGRRWHEEYARCYLAAPPERLRPGGAMEALARAMPHGADYRAALFRSEHTGTSPGGPTADFLRTFDGRHGLDWASALTVVAEEACYDAGRDARDKFKLEGARGVTEPHLLKAIGAQLVARRGLVTEIPHRAVPL